VAIRVFAGDPAAFIDAVTIVKDKFGLRRLVMAGDRGMITSARIDALKAITPGEHAGSQAGLGWITCLRAPAIAKLAADDGPLQMSLFDTQDLAEITHPRLPRRTTHRLPLPRPGRPARPHTPRPAGRYRKTARPHHRPGSQRQTGRR
jgi:hypothetical protein